MLTFESHIGLIIPLQISPEELASALRGFNDIIRKYWPNSVGIIVLMAIMISGWLPFFIITMYVLENFSWFVWTIYMVANFVPMFVWITWRIRRVSQVQITMKI